MTPFTAFIFGVFVGGAGVWCLVYLLLMLTAGQPEED